MFNIIQQDINNGIPKNGNDCPLALAFKRKYPEYNNIWVKDGTLFIDHPDKNISGYFLLDDVCLKFERDFDEGKHVEPIEIIFLGNKDARKVN